MTQILAIANQKGGVGKTTTAVNLAACLAARGQRTLVVDLDPQANATTYLKVDPDKVQTSVQQVLMDAKMPLDQVVVASAYEGLYLAPADITLAKVDMALQTAVSRESVLKRKLTRLDSAFDWVVLDCPPQLGVLTYNAMVAATALVIPVQTEFFSMKGMAQLFEEIELVRETLNPGLGQPRLLATMYDRRIHLNRDVLDFVTRQYEKQLLKTRISRRSVLVESTSYREPIIHFRPRSESALEFDALALEVSELWHSGRRQVSIRNP